MAWIISNPIIGRYEGSRKYDRIELQLDKDQTYEMDFHSCSFAIEAYGTWMTSGDTLFLRAKSINGQTESSLFNIVERQASIYRIETDRLQTMVRGTATDKAWFPLFRTTEK